MKHTEHEPHRHSIGTDANPDFAVIFFRGCTAEEARNAARTMAAAHTLVDACKALHDALSEILEGCTSADREGDKADPFNDYEISRDMRAEGLMAIRKSFRALAKIPGGSEP